ncbi:MAG TPA: chaperone modulator CbpM [Trebonia sp.]|nr:chaperone modulator CbpM [Trebonia sp.]
MKQGAPVKYAMVRVTRLSLDEFAALSGMHPDLIRRLVALGVIDAERDASGDLWFSRAQLAAVARVQRLRAGFALNYAAVGLVTHLLDRIAVLEAALRASRPPGRQPWTRVT